MYNEIAQLLMYGDLEEDSILFRMGEIFAAFERGDYDKTRLIRDINTQVKHILFRRTLSKSDCLEEMIAKHQQGSNTSQAIKQFIARLG